MPRPTQVRAVVAALLGTAAVGLIPLTAQPAAALSDGSVTGVVKSVGPVNLAGVIVVVSQTVSTGTVGETTTAADGSYTIGDIAPGSYYVEFDTDGATITPAGFGYETQWSPGVEDSSQAESVSVSGGAATTVNGDLVEYGEIKGTLTEVGTGTPAANADVQAFNSTASTSLSNPAVTAADGTYTLTRVAPGSVVVQIVDTNDQRYYPQYVGGKYTASEATSVSVAEASVTSGINQSLVGRGVVEGGVTDKSTHQRLDSITVDEVDAAGKTLAVRSSNTSGAYSIYTPAGVAVRFRFSDSGAKYATQYYNNRPTLSCADQVTVAANATKVGVNAAMTTSASQMGKCGGGKKPTAAQLKKSLESQLVPTGSKATRPKIHTANGYVYHFAGLEAGSLVITWKSTGGTKLGSAKVVYTGKSTRTVKVSLNAAGTKAFGKHKHPHLVITGSFTPKGGSAVKASRKFSPAA